MIEKWVTGSFEVRPYDPTVKLAAKETIHQPEEITEFLKSLKTDTRFYVIHLIAMSDGDYYGSNLNADIFEGDELTGIQDEDEAAKNRGKFKNKRVPRYKTFETAKFFRHHANQDHDKAYGDVLLSAWNDVMKRVELLVRIAKQDVPELKMHSGKDITEKFDRRGYITVSMGCHIGSEVCTVCKHEHPTIAERCKCLKDELNQIRSDGRLVAAKNKKVRFFDISDVSIPADPIAYSIQKVASTRPPPNPARDVFEHTSPSFSKHSDMYKEVPVKLEYVNAAKSKATPKDIDIDKISEYVKTAGLQSFVSSATACGIVLSPTEYAYAAFNAPDTDLVNLNPVDFTKVSAPVVQLLKNHIAERSGYFNMVVETGWHPSKLANAVLGDLYALYRNKLDAATSVELSKTASVNGIQVTSEQTTNALAYLSTAGLY